MKKEYKGKSAKCYYSATTKHDIINQFARDTQMRKEIEGICKTNKIDDLMQSLFLILLEKSDEMIIGLNERKQLKWFIIQIVQNQFHSTSSAYFKTFKRNLEYKLEDVGSKQTDFEGNEHGMVVKNSIIETIDVETVKDSEEKILFIQQAIDTLPWYDKELFLLYTLGDKSLVDLQNEIKISRNSIFNTCKKVRKRIKKQVINKQNERGL